MALETASYVANLVVSNPDGGDPRNTADDHIRLIKAALTRTFPKLDAAVSLSSVQISYLGDLSASVQTQLNALRDGPGTANYAIYANSASYAAQAGFAQSASYAVRSSRAESASFAVLAGTATLALTANSASYAALAGHASTATNATNATNAVNAQTAATATSASGAGNANTVGGYAPSDGAVGSTVVARTSAGYVYGTYLNQSSSNSENPVVGQIMVTTGSDDFLRKASAAHVGASLETRNITGRTGVSKTLSSSAPSGGSNGDIHYQY
jgi:hypothetical protein